jgi:8-oxo-dGTP pyrophosphatase MutT (NUDIX family)
MTIRRTLQAGLHRAVARGFGHADARGRPVQAAALPWRRQGDGSIEILLVTGRGRGRWIVPKGWPMRGKSLAQAAAQEAWEEAGVRGRVDEAPLGRFRHAKNHPLLGRLEFRVLLFPLAVETEAADWPERGERRRRWLDCGAAARAVASPALAKLLRRFRPEG